MSDIFPRESENFSALNCSLTFLPHSTLSNWVFHLFLSSLVHTKSGFIECDALLFFINNFKGNINNDNNPSSISKCDLNSKLSYD